MPESKGRDSRSGHYTPQQRRKKQAPNPEWYAPVFVTLLLLGLAWIVVFYVSQGSWPIAGVRLREPRGRVRAPAGRLRDGDALALTPRARCTG